jgi:hypothetical protein
VVPSSVLSAVATSFVKSTNKVSQLGAWCNSLPFFGNMFPALLIYNDFAMETEDLLQRP